MYGGKRITEGDTVVVFASENEGTAMLDRFVGGSEQAKAGLLASVPARRCSTPEVIPETIVFLASESAVYLTGQRVGVGGAYAAQ